MSTVPESRPAVDRDRLARVPEPVPEPPPGLELRSLDVETSAGLLRDWATATVAALFAEEGAAAAEPGGLDQLKLAVWHWRRHEASRLERRALAPLVFRGADARLVHPLSLLLARYLEDRRSWCRRWLPGRLATALTLADPYWPPVLWPVISTLAWREPRFQRATAAAILEHFRRSRLMVEEPAVPVFRVQVWWLAVELVGVPALGRPPEEGTYRILERGLGRRLATALWRSWHRRSGRGHLRQRLSAIARDQIFGAPGWAGFWEQWLVGEIMLRRPELVAEASSASRQVLSILPLLSGEAYREVRNRAALPAPKSVVRELSVIVDPEWEAERPGGPRRASRRFRSASRAASPGPGE